MGMRKDLYRGKNKHGKWYYGFYTEGYYLDGTPVSWIEVVDRRKKDTECPTVISETVGQFIGLTDKNGRKIFEGDIGKYSQTDGAKINGAPIICTGNVIYNAKTASYAVESKDESACKYFDYFPIKDFEVIGNIHDAPELLEVKNDA